MKKRRFPLWTILLLAGYIAFIVMFVVTIFSMPKWLKQAEVIYTEEVQIAIQETFQQTETKQLKEELKQLVDKYPMEIIVQDKNNTLIYSTLPGMTFQDARDSIPDAVSVIEAKGEMEGKNQDFLTWYTIYRPNAEFYVRNLIVIQIGFVLISCLLLLTLTYFLYYKLIKPLIVVKQTIPKLSNYELDDLNISDDDEISSGIQEFAISLQDNITAVSRAHTDLEYALQLERERLQNMITVSRGIIHDLKTPLYQTLLENESFLRQNQELDLQTQHITEYNMQRMDTMMNQITEVLTLMSTNVQEMTEVKDDFDIIQMIKETRASFSSTLAERDLWITTETDEELIVHLNKVSIRLILHNMLSNASQYAAADSEIDLKCYIDEQMLYLSCANDANDEDIERVKNNEQLFHAQGDVAQEENHIYSTGNGVYLIKEFAKILSGTYKLETDNNLVVITVEIPLIIQE